MKYGDARPSVQQVNSTSNCISCFLKGKLLGRTVIWDVKTGNVKEEMHAL